MCKKYLIIIIFWIKRDDWFIFRLEYKAFIFHDTYIDVQYKKTLFYFIFTWKLGLECMICHCTASLD